MGETTARARVRKLLGQDEDCLKVKDREKQKNK